MKAICYFAKLRGAMNSVFQVIIIKGNACE